jgi:competence protein ComGC
MTIASASRRFTLVELLILMVVIVMLVAFTIPRCIATTAKQTHHDGAKQPRARRALQNEARDYPPTSEISGAGLASSPTFERN